MHALMPAENRESPKVLIGTDDPGDSWDAFVAGHPAGHLMQSRAWARVRQDTGWQPLFLSLLDESGPCGAALCLLRTIPLTGFRLLYIPRGPVVDYSNSTLVEALGAALREVARTHRVFLAQTDPAIRTDSLDAHRGLERMGFRRESKHGLFRIGQPLRVMRLPIDEYVDPAGLRAALPHKTRYNIHLAERKGVAVRARTDREALQVFHTMLRAHGKAKGFPVRGLRYHEAIWQHCVRPGLGVYLFAEHTDRLLAAIQVLRFGPTAWYMYGASPPEDRNLMSTYLLQWQGIRWAWAAGCRCYDMRGVYSASPKPGDPEFGVYDFKRRFGAQMVTFLGEYDWVVRPQFYRLWRSLERAAQRPASWALRLQRLWGDW